MGVSAMSGRGSGRGTGWAVVVGLAEPVEEAAAAAVEHTGGSCAGHVTTPGSPVEGVGWGEEPPAAAAAAVVAVGTAEATAAPQPDWRDSLEHQSIDSHHWSLLEALLMYKQTHTPQTSQRTAILIRGVASFHGTTITSGVQG